MPAIPPRQPRSKARSDDAGYATGSYRFGGKTAESAPPCHPILLTGRGRQRPVSSSAPALPFRCELPAEPHELRIGHVFDTVRQSEWRQLADAVLIGLKKPDLFLTQG